MYIPRRLCILACGSFTLHSTHLVSLPPLLQALSVSPDLTPTRVHLHLPGLRLNLSPADYKGLLFVMEACTSTEDGRGGSARIVKPWELADYRGPVGLLIRTVRRGM